jgi:hypothetical protein
MALVMEAQRPTTVGAAVTGRAPNWSLWSAEDLLRWLLTVGAGAIVVAVSWYVCAGDASFNRQIGPLDAAAAGLVLGGLGNVMWLVRGRRVLGERRRALLPDPLTLIAGSAGAAGSAPTALAPVPAAVEEIAGDPAGLFVAGDGLARFHRPGCALAEGRDWVASSRRQHEDAGRMPCGICRP